MIYRRSINVKVGPAAFAFGRGLSSPSGRVLAKDWSPTRADIRAGTQGGRFLGHRRPNAGSAPPRSHVFSAPREGWLTPEQAAKLADNNAHSRDNRARHRRPWQQQSRARSIGTPSDARSSVRVLARQGRWRAAWRWWPREASLDRSARSGRLTAGDGTENGLSGSEQRMSDDPASAGLFVTPARYPMASIGRSEAVST